MVEYIHLPHVFVHFDFDEDSCAEMSVWLH